MPTSFYTLFANIEAILWVVLFFGGSIFVHELGHFLAARKRGLQVDRFSIGFGPKILSWKREGVEYCISLLPLGGYVALPQLADLQELEGGYKKPASKLPPVSYVDRLLVLVMGAVFNLIFAFFLATLLWAVGQPMSEEEGTTVVGYVAKTLHLDEARTAPGPAYLAGIQVGDRVLAVDGVPVKRFTDIEQTLVTGSGRDAEGNPQVNFLIERAGQQIELSLKPVLALANVTSGETLRIVGISPAHSITVGQVLPHSPAEEAGLRPGDCLLSIDNQPLFSMIQLSEYLNSTAGNPVTLSLLRGKESLTLAVAPALVAYTQPSLKLSAQEDPGAVLTLIPDSGMPMAMPMSNDTPIGGLLIFDIHEGDQGKRFSQLHIGDRIVGLADGHGITSLTVFEKALQALKHEHPTAIIQSSHEATFFWTAPSALVPEIVAPRTHAMLGFIRNTTPVTVHIPPLDQFKNAIRMTFRVLGSLFNRGSDIGLNNLMGPPGIMRVLHTFSTIDVRLVIAFTVLLNINLAILNLLPIPVLDGGQILFATLARLRGRPLPQRLVSSIQETFMLMLFALMLYVSFFDVRRWQGDRATEKRMELQSEYYLEPTFSPSREVATIEKK